MKWVGGYSSGSAYQYSKHNTMSSGAKKATAVRYFDAGGSSLYLTFRPLRLSVTIGCPTRRIIMYDNCQTDWGLGRLLLCG
jgi:hypothetical protein